MSRPAFPGFALSLSVLWLLTGALYKLFDGSPNDLPPMVVDKSPFDMWDTFRYAILVELAVVGLVLTVPRVGWFVLAGTFATFLAILFPLAANGEASCGCFGSNVQIKPVVMMSIDGGLLLLLLSAKPWRLPKESGLGMAAFLPFLALAIAAPLLKLQQADAPARPVVPAVAVTPPVAGGSDATNADPVETPDDEAPAPSESPVDGGADSVPAADGAADPDAAPAPDLAGVDATPAEDTEPDPAAAPLPEFEELDWQDWTGKDFYETDIAAYADYSQGAVLPNSHVVVYRQTCEVCKEHLETLWEETQNEPDKWLETSLVLIRIVETKDTPENNLCTLLPEPSQKVSLPALRRGYGITTPLAFDVDESNLVQNVVDVRELLGH